MSKTKLKRSKKTYSKKTKLAIVISSVVLAVVAIAAISVVIILNLQVAAEDAAVAQLEEDYKTGDACIPASRVAEFEDQTDACVDFYAAYVNDSKYYVFANNDKESPTFALMFNKNLITTKNAIDKFLGQHIQAHGTIEKYRDIHVIKITDFSQVEIAE